MAAMTKHQFKRRWMSDDNGGGITFDDCANCYIAWGLGQSPRAKSLLQVRYDVLKAADVPDAEDYAPGEQDW
jgi:hypothetical protein